MTVPQFELLTELKLIDPIRRKIDEAYVPNDHPIVMASVDEDGRPVLSFRGSTHVHSDTQIAVWARRSEGNTARALAKNPHVALIFREPNPAGGRSAAVITMRGRARVVTDEAVRRKVYGSMPEVERTADPDCTGVAIIIDLDSVTGFIPGYRLQMTR
ncbi:MAG TPA: pyridoxamine 5'-phosphate oxidase family protein [Dehalococcoidia bacterium]|nr:pyridoxamine 5'-phosphate oxidase family protein [Dehalococcoidia bacterium]